MARWLLPNLCAAVFAVTLFQVLFFAGGHALYRDSDTGWHIVTGESILQTRSVPTSDHFSFTRAGRPWMAWEWLSDVAFAAANRAAGLRGVELLAALAIALAVAGSTVLALRLGANFFAAAGSAALLLAVTSVHWLARPHIFGWLFALAFLAVAETHRPGRKLLWLLPALAIPWANMHGSSILGPAILLIYALRRAGRRDYLLASMLSLAATFANPYGWRLHQHIFEYLRDSYIMDHIGEFHSFDFHASGAIWVELFIVAAVACMIDALRRREWPVAILTAALIHQGFFAARHWPVAALLILPLAASRLRFDSQYADRLRAIDRRIVGAIPAMAAVALAAFLLVAEKPADRGFDPKTFPVQAAGFFADRAAILPEARVFSTDQWGGYLIYRLAGHQRVFIDGRSDFYGADFLTRYGIAREARPGWDRVLDSEGVTHVIIGPEEPLAAALHTSPEWKVVRTDRVAEIFERDYCRRKAGE